MPTMSAGQVVILVLIFFLLGYTFYSALFAAVGAMVSSEQEAQQAQMPVVLLLVVSIMFLQPVLNEPDGSSRRWVAAVFVADHDAAADERGERPAVGDRRVDLRAGRRLLHRGVCRGAHVSHRAAHVRQTADDAGGSPVGAGSAVMHLRI